MPSSLSTNRTIIITDAGERFDELVAEVVQRRGQVVLEANGVAVAALIPAADLARLRRYDAERAADFAIVDQMRAAFADVPDDELEREIAKAIAEVRAEMREERARAAHAS